MSIVSIAQIILLTLLILYATRTYGRFVRYLNAAKASNIPYIIVPVYWINPIWRIAQSFCVPILRLLPARWTDPWLRLIQENWTWIDRFALFERLGTDAFLTVSPGGNALYVANASVINEITSRRIDFPKPVRNYKLLEIYGRSLISSEGSVWKHHRKITSPLFTEKINHTVWVESLLQAQAMLKNWFDGNDDRTPSINTIEEDTMRLSLHVILRVGFGIHLSWPGAETGQKGEIENTSSAGMRSNQSPENGRGHVMSYADAIKTVLREIVLILLVPRFLLKYLPFKKTKNAYTAYNEWGKYMQEIFEASKKKLAAGEMEEGTDFMASLVRGAGAVPNRSATSSPADESSAVNKQTLTDSEILGNVFLFILAGHETSANSLLFSFIYLALNMAPQRQLQSDLDRIFQKRKIEQWDYRQDVPKLYGSMVEAVLNEQLRLVPPVVVIPKCTLNSQPDQNIVINDNKCKIPAGTFINILTVAVHRNPQFWPAGPPTDPQHPAHPISNTENDLEEFKPERWLDGPHSSYSNTTEPNSQSDLNSIDQPINFFRPQKGAFIPFSEGPRSCIGRRFAQTEILTVLAVIFSQYSVELAVDKFASDKELEAMTANEKGNVWKKAKEETEKAMIEDMGSILSLKFRSSKIPLRFVRRGKETFSRT